MALSAVEALALAKKYTGDTAEEFGAVKGAPCEVADIQNGDGTHTVTFQWQNSQGDTRSDSLTLLDGKDGKDGKDGVDGQDGQDGQDGAQGPQGPTGPQGPAGPQGPTGPSGGPIPAGGTKNQVLKKKSAQDGDVYWANEEGGGGGGGDLTEDITAAITVGGITAGTTYEAGTPIEDVLADMLEPTLYPTFMAPSASLSASPTGTLYEKGAMVSITFTVNFNRGSITPAYGTSGYRAGAAEGYILNGGSPQVSNTFTEVVTSGNKSFVGKVNYTAGEQPKDSKGNDYDEPLANGTVITAARNYEFVEALWANTGDIALVTKETLVSKSTKVKEFNFPAQTVEHPEIFDVPKTWTVTAVEVLNTLSNQWEDCSGEFTTSNTTHTDAAGNSVNYTRYTDNRGYAAGARKVRVKWS